MLARLTCSRRCIVTAVATVSIAGARPFVVQSKTAVLEGGGSKTVALSFSRAQLQTVRRAASAHAAIDASVVGQVIDSGGNVEAATGAQALAITS